MHKSKQQLIKEANAKPSSALSSWVRQLNHKIVQAFCVDSNIIEKINNLDINAQQVKIVQGEKKDNSKSQKERKQIKNIPCEVSNKRLYQLFQQTNISFKIKKSLKQLYQNIINLEEKGDNVSDQDLQNSFKQRSFNQNQIFQNEQNNIKQVMEQDQSPSRLNQVKQFCSNLNERVIASYQSKNFQILFTLIEEICLNNSYQCMQSSFQLLKSKYRVLKKSTQRKNSGIKDSMKKSQTSDIQFNMELTMKSRNSNKNSYIDRHDSLVYSNATSFGLQNTQNRSSDIKRKNNLKNLQNQGQQLQMIVIDRTSSRGGIDNQERGLSSKSLSDNQKAIKDPPRFSYQDYSNRSNKSKNRLSSQQSTERKGSQQQIKKSPILQEDTYQVQKSQNSSFREEEASDKKEKNKFTIKKQVNMTHSQSKRKIIKSSMPVFTSEIQNLQGKINKIKQAKLLKKKKLEEELAKLNKQIVQLKIQQPQQQIRQIHQFKVPPNAYESRIKINDDIQSKEKAEKLVKNLKSQKRNRQQVKRHQNKVLDMNLHQQMEEIMKMRYFNEERIKQKKKLEIIERMKKQQIRKITEQKLKQASSQFLVKLKPSAVRNNIKNTVDYQDPSQQQITEQNNNHMATPSKNLNLSRKKQYSHLSKNFNIIKQPHEDKYEQALN